jgi:hypothetical protein
MQKIDNSYFGKTITVESKFKRGYGERGTYPHIMKVWKEVKLRKKTEVTIIGVRTLSNGTRESMGEEGVLYTATEHFRALLVVKSIYSKPFFTPIT